MRRDCACPEWGPNIEKVNAPLMLAYARNPNVGAMYSGVPFRYCPWCGQELIDRPSVQQFAGPNEVKP